MLRYRYVYNGEIIDEGLANNVLDLKRIHMRRMSDKEATKVRTFCRKNDILSCQVRCEYAEEPYVDWNVLVDKEEDRARAEKTYKELLKELNRSINWVRYNKKILDFLLDSDEEYYCVDVPKPAGWDDWREFDQKSFLKRTLGGGAFVLVAPDNKIEIFDRIYPSTDDEGRFIVKGRVRADMRRIITASFYNRIIYCAHKVNLLAKELGYKPVPVRKEDMPRYEETKELKNEGSADK